MTRFIAELITAFALVNVGIFLPGFLQLIFGG